jgi:hypothetical protein
MYETNELSEGAYLEKEFGQLFSRTLEMECTLESLVNRKR